MNRFCSRLPPSVWFLAGLLICPLSQAGDVTLRVRDQSGQPLQDAVVTLRPVDAAPATTSAETTAVMDQRGKAFVPRVLAVRTGTRVEFPNSDRVRHHVYSFSPPKPFELKLYSMVETPSVTFDRSGVVSLGCNIHDWMQGYIYVTDDPLFTVSEADGVARFTGLADGAYRMHIWHPRLRGAYMGEQYDLRIDGAAQAPHEYRIEVRANQPVQQPPSADMAPVYGGRL